MCYGDCSCAIKRLKTLHGLTETEAKATLNMARDKVKTGELEPWEALAEMGLDDRFMLALDEWPD
jgi:hypothetical protein